MVQRDSGIAGEELLVLGERMRDRLARTFNLRKLNHKAMDQGWRLRAGRWGGGDCDQVQTNVAKSAIEEATSVL